MQYRLGNAGPYTDVSATLEVFKGDTVTFKAVATAATPEGICIWPGGKPVWGGTAPGAAGTGDETKAVTFNTIGTNNYTVTAECGTTKTATIKVKPKAEITSISNNYAIDDVTDRYNISGSYIKLNFNVKSYPSTVHTVSVLVDNAVLASTSTHVGLDKSVSGQPDKLTTDANGNWSGVIKFNTTGLPSGRHGDLQIRLAPTGKNAFDSVSAAHEANVYNRAYVLSNSSDPNLLPMATAAANVVEQKLTSMKHGVVKANSDNPTTISMNIPDKTVFFIYTHGDYYTPTFETRFQACNGSWVHSTDVMGAVNGKNGQPQYNVVFINACYSAGDSGVVRYDMAKAFGIINNPSLTTIADRAYVGWRDVVYNCQENVDWTSTFFEELYAGKTVEKAAQAATAAIAPRTLPGTVEIIGDKNTTLNKVHSGSIK